MSVVQPPKLWPLMPMRSASIAGRLGCARQQSIDDEGHVRGSRWRRLDKTTPDRAGLPICAAIIA
jgi:hypothetical protein